MSFCTTASCLAHRREVFIQLWPDGPPYPWLHSAGMWPCDGLPPATPEQAGEACVGCGHDSGRHPVPDLPWPLSARAPRPCLDCGCTRLENVA